MYLIRGRVMSDWCSDERIVPVIKEIKGAFTKEESARNREMLKRIMVSINKNKQSDIK